MQGAAGQNIPYRQAQINIIAFPVIKYNSLSLSSGIAQNVPNGANANGGTEKAKHLFKEVQKVGLLLVTAEPIALNLSQ